MKFLCIGCDEVMAFAERQLPGDGTMAAVFACGQCGREVAMLTNPMETQLVSSLGVKVGGRGVPEQPMELLRSSLTTGGEHAFAEPDAEPEAGLTRRRGEAEEAPAEPATVRVVWNREAMERLGRVPGFVRGMVKRIYADWARERGIAEITPEVMDRAREELGLEGM